MRVIRITPDDGSINRGARGIVAEVIEFSFTPIVSHDPNKPQSPVLIAEGLRMTIQTQVCERLKRLGFSRQHQIKLYGSQFELVGDPVVISEDVVFVDAVEQKSGQLQRVRIPLNIVRMATEKRSAA